MGEDKKSNSWVSAWSTSPIDASLSETGVLDRLGVAVTDVSARTAVQLTAGGTHVRLTLSNVFGVLPLHVAACTVAIGADDARGIDPATLHTVTFGGERCVGRRRADADRHGLLPRHQRHAHDRAHRRVQLRRARQLHAPPPAASGHTDAAHGGDRRVRGHPRAHGGRRAGSARDARVRHLRRLNRGKRAAAPAGGAPARRRDRQRERDAGRHQG